MERIPEPTKTAMRAYGYFKREEKNTNQIAKVMRLKESEVLDMINWVRTWIAQEDNRAA